MKEKIHLFVDNSNVLHEGRRLSMTRKLRRPRRGSDLDQAYEIDWGKFLHLVKEDDKRILADDPYLYGSRPPPNDSVWERIRNDGYDVQVFDRNIRNKEKGVDMKLGLDVAERLFTIEGGQTIVIAGGDADYLPVVATARERAWKVEVWFWSNAATVLKNAADRFYELDAQLDYLRLGGGIVFPA